MPICDAGPGECATTCNGGLPCVIGWLLEEPDVCKNNYWFCTCSSGGWCPGGNAPGYVGQSCGDILYECSDGTSCSRDADCAAYTGQCFTDRRCSDGAVCFSDAQCSALYTDGVCRVVSKTCWDGRACHSNADCTFGGPGGACLPRFSGTCTTPCLQDEKCPEEGQYLCYGETQIPTCCSSVRCGDGVCSAGAGETHANCPTDCPSQAPFCGDGACNGSETCNTCPGDCPCGPVCGNGDCQSGESCASCPADCSCAGPCGNGACQTGETCANCSADCGVCQVCGDGVCNGSETCSTCEADCGICTGPFCGDTLCTGFENCWICGVDCGVCPLLNNWFQVAGGNLYAGAATGRAVDLNIPYQTCIEPACKPYLMVSDRNNTPGSTGVAITGGAEIDTDGFTTEGEEDVAATGTVMTHIRENYAFFYRRYSLGFNPKDNFKHTARDARKPTTPRAYHYHGGDLAILSPWRVAADESIVVFVDGDLAISDPDEVGALITVEPGGFLAFIVKGDITVQSDVGNTALDDATANVEGIYVADGVLQVTSTGSRDDRRFVGEGTFVGWTDVRLDRDLGETGNAATPAETFVFRPDLAANLPRQMKRSQIIWQETN